MTIVPDIQIPDIEFSVETIMKNNRELKATDTDFDTSLRSNLFSGITKCVSSKCLFSHKKSLSFSAT